MQLQFQYMHGITLTGEQPSAFHYRDQYVKLGWIDGAGDMRSMQADTPYGDWSSPSFSAHRSGVYDPAEDPNVNFLRMFSYSGVEHWIVWKRHLDSQHRIAKYKYYVIAFEAVIQTINDMFRYFTLGPAGLTVSIQLSSFRLPSFVTLGIDRGRVVIQLANTRMLITYRFMMQVCAVHLTTLEDHFGYYVRGKMHDLMCRIPVVGGRISRAFGGAKVRKQCNTTRKC